MSKRLATAGSTAELRDQLVRWTFEGIIDPAQAERILTAEQAPPDGRALTALAAGDGPAPAPGTRSPRRSLPLIAEVLGYVGAVIALSAGLDVLRHLWPKVPAAASLTFTAVAAAGLIVAGSSLAARDDPAFRRLRGVLWLFATVSAASFIAVLTSQVFKLDDTAVGLLSEAGWTVTAALLWWRNRSALQHVAVFAGLVALDVTGLNQVDPSISITWLGVAVVVLSAVWIVASSRGYLAPLTAGLATGGIGALAGAILTTQAPAGEALALVTVAGLLAAGAATRREILIVIGALGALWVIPDTVDRYLPGSVAAPVAVATTGLALFGIALWMARARKSAA